MRIAIAAFVCALAASAQAHDFGCDGKPVPENIKAACCGKADYHRLGFDQIEEDDQGYVIHVNGYTAHVPRNQALPSPDGCPAIFYNDANAAMGFLTVYCFFFDPPV